jgi:nucleotide-binding universal stress UspA family protein
MRILIGVDGSSAAEVACEFVANRTWPSGSHVRLLGAVETMVDWTGFAPVADGSVEGQRAALAEILEERAEILRRCGLSVEATVELGRAPEVILQVANEEMVDLIVVGSRGLGPIASVVLGSVSAHLVDHATCPVLVVRSSEATRMLLATDGTPSSREIPHVLAGWGPAFRGLPVEVLSVAHGEGFVTPWAAEDDGHQPHADLVVHHEIAERVAEELAELGWHAEAISRAGDASRQIIDESREWGADLIVTGSRGIGTIRRIVAGSVAHDVLTHARSSVLVMRGHVPARIREAAPASVGLASG